MDKCLMKILATLLLLISMPLLAEYPLAIIQLKSRAVEDVIPIIKPFLDSDASVAGMTNQLIVRTSEKNLREIRKILDRIDRPSRRLMIYVRQRAGDNITRDGSAADINAEARNAGKVVVGQTKPRSFFRYRTSGGRTRSDQDITQRVQTLDGQQAFFATGTEVPIGSYDFTAWGPHAYGSHSTVFKDVTTGFYVLPRLNGDRVTLMVSPQMMRLRMDESYDVTQAGTTLSGRLGEWMTLGGASQAGYVDSRGVGFRATTQGRQDRNISLRVEAID